MGRLTKFILQNAGQWIIPTQSAIIPEGYTIMAMYSPKSMETPPDLICYMIRERHSISCPMCELGGKETSHEKKRPFQMVQADMPSSRSCLVQLCVTISSTICEFRNSTSTSLSPQKDTLLIAQSIRAAVIGISGLTPLE